MAYRKNQTLNRRRLLLSAGAILSGSTLPISFSEANMIEPASVSEQMMYCTTRIIGVTTLGQLTGSGFLFNFVDGENHPVPVLITNKHVVDGTTKLSIRLHTKSDQKNPPDGNQDLVLPAGNSGQWVRHSDAEVDLCALPINPFLARMSPPPFFKALGPSLIPSAAQLQDLDAIENVIMVGYPNGLWDEYNNFPIVRRGITATHPAIDFDGKPVTVIDIAAFPGSSGSPVFLYNKSGYSNKQGMVIVGSDQIYFLGILFAGPYIRADGKIEIRGAPTAAESIPVINMMMNLGYMVKSSEILSLGEQLFHQYGITLPGKASP